MKHIHIKSIASILTLAILTAPFYQNAAFANSSVIRADGEVGQIPTSMEDSGVRTKFPSPNHPVKPGFGFDPIFQLPIFPDLLIGEVDGLEIEPFPPFQILGGEIGGWWINNDLFAELP